MNKTAYAILRGGYGIARNINRKFKGYKLKRSTKFQYLKSKEYSNLFAGYYDHSPFNSENDSLLLLHGNNQAIWKPPTRGVYTDILLFNWKENRVEKFLGNTLAWNWQQGSRLMWVDSTQLIYNDYDSKKDKYFAWLGNIESDDRELFEYPVQELSSCKMRYYSISFEALTCIRPDYGYPCKDVQEGNYINEGITEVEIANGNSTLIVRINDLVKLSEKLAKGKIHRYKINHLLSSPSGNKMLFMFRYHTQQNYRVTDVYIYNRDEKDYKLILNDNNVSHYCWVDDESFVFTGSVNGLFGYYTYSLINNETTLLYKSIDGHPVVMDEGRVLTDTYPNKMGVRSLELRSSVKNEMKLKKVLFQSVEPWFIWGSQRCDFHPSVSKNLDYWQIDVVKNNRRTVCIGNFK